MAVTIKIVKRKACSECGGTRTRTHTIMCQGKSATMTLPCLVCNPITRIPNLGVMLPVGKKLR